MCDQKVLAALLYFKQNFKNISLLVLCNQYNFLTVALFFFFQNDQQHSKKLYIKAQNDTYIKAQK